MLCWLNFLQESFEFLFGYKSKSDILDSHVEKKQ